jgi:hypothetical protein
VVCCSVTVRRSGGRELRRKELGGGGRRGNDVPPNGFERFVRVAFGGLRWRRRESGGSGRCGRGVGIAIDWRCCAVCGRFRCRCGREGKKGGVELADVGDDARFALAFDDGG